MKNFTDISALHSAPQDVYNSQFFAWACSDLKNANLKVVIVSPKGGSGVLTFVFLDTQIFPHKCSINGDTFLKQ